MTLHTGGPCTFNAPANEESGVSNNDNYDCNLNSAVGCSVQGPVGSYGSSLNAHGGGVFAMEWTSSFIKIFFFPRNAIPADITADITADKPNPSSWGLPAAEFDSQYGNCDIDANFPPQTIVSRNPLLPLPDRYKRDLKWRRTDTVHSTSIQRSAVQELEEILGPTGRTAQARLAIQPAKTT